MLNYFNISKNFYNSCCNFFIKFKHIDCIFLIILILSFIQVIFTFTAINKLNTIVDSENSIKTIKNYINLYCILSILSIVICFIYYFTSEFNRYKKSFKYLYIILSIFLILLGIVIRNEDKKNNSQFKIYTPDILILCPFIILILTIFGF
jgi:hypothetical protein